MSHGKDRHDGHDVDDVPHDGHDDGGRRNFRMRLPSPLPEDTERVMTRVIDCAMEVHRGLGPGFLESIYQNAMQVELSKAGLPFDSEKPIEVVYGGVALKGQRVDLVVAGVVVVELKCVTRFETIHESQVVSYLRTMGLRAGLLINFNVTLLHRGLKRIVL
jgi:GxxExxY protein